jgi:peptidyl-prolyl cis-trans isomerase SurA
MNCITIFKRSLHARHAVQQLILPVALLAIALFNAPASALKKLDGVAAFVGDSIILHSELQAYVLLKMGGLADTTLDSAKKAQMRVQALDELIEGKVLLVRAEKDTNITITENEVDAQLNARIQALLAQNGLSLSSFEELLQAQQGISLAKFKAEVRRQIRQELLKQKVQHQYVAAASIGKSDVELFYSQYKDSLPPAGKSVLLSTVTIHVEPSEEIRQRAFEKISAIKERLDNGEDFSEVAMQFSEGPNAAMGGDLGFISKGTLTELEFEEKIFSMQPGQISDTIQTRLGFHIVMVMERKEHMVHVKQIFVAVSPPQEQLKATRELLDSIAAASKSAEDFAAAAAKYSTDEISKSQGGRLPWQEVSKLSPLVRAAVDTLKSGDISHVIRDNNVFSVYRVNERKDSRRLTLENDWNEISAIAQRVLAQQKLLDLVRKWRQETYIDIRL